MEIIKTKRGTPEWREKISKGRKGKSGPGYWKGKTHTDEYKKNMSESLSGENNPRYGIKLDKNLKNTIGNSIKNFYSKNGTDHLKGTRPQTSDSLKGHKLSEKTKSKIAKKAIGRLQSVKTRMKRSNSLKGELCYLWKGGATAKNKLDRMSVEYKLWREAVFKRDNYTCQKCNKRGCINLEAHHIKSFSENISERYNIDNGITYCIKCHSEEDKLRNRFIKK